VHNFQEQLAAISKEEVEMIQPNTTFCLADLNGRITAKIFLQYLYNYSFDKSEASQNKLAILPTVIGGWLSGIIFSSLLLPEFVFNTKTVKNFITRKLALFYDIAEHMKTDPSSKSLWKNLANQESDNFKFSWEEFRNESVGLLIAGVETTSHAQSSVMWSLTKFPEVMVKLRNDIDRVTGGKRQVTIEDLPNLLYLEKVILESLRYNGVVPSLNRVATINDSIGGFAIPKGIEVWTSPYLAVRSAFENPDKFDPDRYTEENITEASKIVMGEFGEGPHVCVGKYLALMELRLITAYLVQCNVQCDINTAQWDPHFPIIAPKNLQAKMCL